jgi:Fibronectin type III domain
MHRFISFFLLLVSGTSFGQTFPVQVTAQLTAPYSLTLSDYTAATTDRIVFNVFADVSRPNLQVRFVLKIEGQNVLLQTKPEFIPPPINLQGGIPERFTGFDLAAYFDPANLNFQGITRQQFQRTGMLPEGLYRFQLEVYEYNRGVKISNTGTATGWLILNDPPLVNLPRNNEKLKVQEPQNVVLQWTPRHTGSPNAAFTTEYEVSLVEVWPATRNANDAMLTSPPILETTTNSTTFVYGPAETPLEPGRRYAFRIKAKSLSGVEEINLFKNNGYSEVVSFVYGDACDLPTGIKAEAISSSRIGLQWQPLINHTAYSVRYRPQGSASSPWYENSLLFNTTELTSLKPNTRYEYQLAATCGAYNSAYTTIATITTKAAPTIDYSCGLPIVPYNLDPTELIPSLKVGDIIEAGDFNVTLTKVSGSNGVFSGEGVIEVPYFNKAKVKTSFTNITVNKEMRMVTGYMNVTGAGVEVIPQDVLDLMDDLSEGLDLLDTALTIVENNTPDYFDPNAFVADTLITIGGVITDVYNDGNGGIVIVANGKETRIPEGTPTAIADAAGNGYLVDSKGTVHKTDATTAKRAGNREYNLSLIFTAADDGKYGFDKKQHEALANQYEKIDNTYDVPWKALAAGQSDKVLAKLEGSGIDANKIRYEMGGQSLSPNALPIAIGTSNAQLLNPVGKSEGTEESLLALYTPTDTTKKQQVLGKLNVVSYNAIQKTLIVVPINGNTYSGTEQSLRTSLNRIYGQAAVSWNVSIATQISVDGIELFDDGESGLLTNYTPSMKQVINAYKDNIQDDTYYIFLVSNPKNNKDLQGYMPRSKEVGFVFIDNHSSEEALIHTIAHELAHGAFNLQHTFSEENFTLAKGTTDNLMDYSKGTKLYKYQWDKIRCPDIVIGLLEGDEEAASSWILIDEKHTRLFNHVYDNHKESDHTYLDKVKSLTGTGAESFELSYSDSEDSEWIKSWKIRVTDFKTALTDELDRIKSTKKGEKISQISIRQKHIYLGDFEYEGETYSIAMYGNGSVQDMLNAFIKIEVEKFEDLKKDENKKHIYVEETYTKYFIVALYEENRSEPSVIMQLEKVVWGNSLEKWLKFLRILVEVEEENENEDVEVPEKLGEDRVASAESMNNSDTRFYRQVIEDNGRLTDTYVDCAEFIYDILKMESLTPPSGDCVIQFNWYKKEGYEWGTDVEEIKKGDILLWDDPDDSSDPEKALNHSGLAIKDYAKGDIYIPIIHSGRNGCYCGGYSYPVYKKDEEGNVLVDSVTNKKIVVYETAEDCYETCADGKKYSITKLTTYIDSNGNAVDDDLYLKYWVRPKKK